MELRETMHNEYSKKLSGLWGNYYTIIIKDIMPFFNKKVELTVYKQGQVVYYKRSNVKNFYKKNKKWLGLRGEDGDVNAIYIYDIYDNEIKDQLDKQLSDNLPQTKTLHRLEVFKFSQRML